MLVSRSLRADIVAVEGLFEVGLLRCDCVSVCLRVLLDVRVCCWSRREADGKATSLLFATALVGGATPGLGDEVSDGTCEPGSALSCLFFERHVF